MKSWRRYAACRDIDTSVFFPHDRFGTTIAKRVCAACPVQGECLAFAVDHEELVGIFGGRTESERVELRRRMRVTPAAYG